MLKWKSCIHFAFLCLTSLTDKGLPLVAIGFNPSSLLRRRHRGAVSPMVRTSQPVPEGRFFPIRPPPGIFEESDPGVMGNQERADPAFNDTRDLRILSLILYSGQIGVSASAVLLTVVPALFL